MMSDFRKNGGLKINLSFRIDFIAGYSIFWYNRFMGLRMSLDNNRIKLSNRILQDELEVKYARLSRTEQIRIIDNLIRMGGIVHGYTDRE